MLKDEKATAGEEPELGSNPDKQANYDQCRVFAIAKKVTPLQLSKSRDT
jgi:hypothetical protein